MLSLPNLALAATALIGLTAAAPTQFEARQTFVPGTLNNTQEFYIGIKTFQGSPKYDGYHLEAYHTGAGFADPVFTPTVGSRAYLNGTSLQFDVSLYPFSANGFPSDTNYARWEPVTISSGYGSQDWYIEDGKLVVKEEESDGWLVCEWYHDVNAPQLFQLIKGFDSVVGAPAGQALVLPETCSRVDLLVNYF